jgi:predicted metalloendopeptidase
VDAKDPARYTIVVTQAGLGLPSRDFYLSDTFAKVLEEYGRYVERMLTLANVPSAAASAIAIVDLEKRIAQLQWPLEKVRNKDLTYNPKSRSELEAFAPGFPWAEALASAGLSTRDRFVVREADAVAGLAELFRATPVATWRAYLTFHYLNREADIMPSAFDDASFAFNGKTLGGQPEQLPRWRRAVADINGPYAAGPLGDAVGRLYVREFFPPEARAAVKLLVQNLLEAYQRRIEQLPWMSPETRMVAIRKAQTVRIKIGYPDRWRDYSPLTIVPGDAYGNRKRLSRFETARELARLDRAPDKDEWSQGPQTVNAYYQAEFNEIAFPAAILQPPFFDPNADPAVNYGGIGGVIGHEMGHGYDDQGAKSDENGILRTWWKPEDEERFRGLTRALAAQYSSYSPLPGLHVNGDFTSGENIGDLGGLSVALDAYQHSLGGTQAPVLDGFTGVERFFLGWGQVWRGKYRDERLRALLTSDFHSPVMFRVNGVVRNMDAWYDAFSVQPANRLYVAPADRVRIW